MKNRLLSGFAVAMLVFASSPLRAEDVKSPEEIFGTRPNNLATLPAHWAVEKPVQLQVLFNLKYPPNSPEADAFLAEYVRFEKSLPYKFDLTVMRVMAPAKYTYAARLTFANWHDFQVYDKSDVFLKWYYATWKPIVTGAEELLTVLDPVTGTAR